MDVNLGRLTVAELKKLIEGADDTETLRHLLLKNDTSSFNVKFCFDYFDDPSYDRVINLNELETKGEPYYGFSKAVKKLLSQGETCMNVQTAMFSKIGEIKSAYVSSPSVIHHQFDLIEETSYYSDYEYYELEEEEEEED